MKRKLCFAVGPDFECMQHKNFFRQPVLNLLHVDTPRIANKPKTWGCAAIYVSLN